MNTFDRQYKELESLTNEYRDIKVDESTDYSKFYLYSIISHSTQIEGSTLSELDTQLLFDDGLTANGKPMIFHLMNIDLKKAYDFALEEANKQTKITVPLIQKFSSLLMQQTGAKHNSTSGTWDSSMGDFRLHGVTAGVGGRSYLNYQKIPKAMDDFIERLQSENNKVSTVGEKYNLSFNAHLDLLTIHPFGDGNGRVSRLLMNYIQFMYNLIPTKLMVDNKAEYIKTLKEAQENNDIISYKNFLMN